MTMKIDFWNHAKPEGIPPGFYPVLRYWDESEGFHPAGAHWDGQRWSRTAVVAWGNVRCDGIVHGERIAYEHDPEDRP